MGWFANKFQTWSESTQIKEIENFNEGLSGMDSHEVGMVLAVATDRRHRLAKLYQWDLLDPIILMEASPEVAMKLGSIIKQTQAKSSTPVAGALMVWLHTLRSTNTPLMRVRGRALWGQLERGMPHLYDGAISWGQLSSEVLDIDGGDSFPVGLNPRTR